MNQRPILVIAAMDVEFELLKNNLQKLKVTKISTYNYYEGEINDFPVIICDCRIASINAAIATYIGIEKYNPIAIINEGTAGGHSINIHKGDIVIGEKCINIISSKTPIKNKGEGSNTLDWDLTNFIVGEPNRLIYQQADSYLIDLAKSLEYLEGKVHVGTIGSGDIWNKEIDRILMLNEKYGTLCEDMEANAIYTVANQFNIPVIGIKIISNNEILGEIYEREIGEKSQKFTYELIKKIIEKNNIQDDNI